ncbi:hypothetical protein ACT1UG_02375 [Bacillus paramycoides]|uniref:hypothetical protein n=1 Tax=Bacillus cereus group TaxID=86661 RepID=UPI001F59EE7A|nr:hypothetical protein [Bacillus cereus group sp. BfR-BA-01310]
MIDFRLKNVFKEIENAIEKKGLAHSIKFEDTDSKNIKVLDVEGIRVGKLVITYPDDRSESIDCCNASINFEFYLKEDEGNFDFFIDNLCSFSKARFNS